MRRKFSKGDLANRLGLFMEQLVFCIGGADEHERWRRASRTYRARLRGEMWKRFCRLRDDPMVVERVRAVFDFSPPLLRLVLDLGPDDMNMIRMALAGDDHGSSRPITLAGFGAGCGPGVRWNATAWGSPWPWCLSARQAMAEAIAGLAPAPGNLSAVL